MNNLLLSAAIGDIAGMPYEFKGRTKDYNTVDLLLPTNTIPMILYVPLPVQKHY